MEKKNNNVLYSEKVNGNNKVYFLDLKQAENDANYLVITQSKSVGEDKYERKRMILFENEVEQLGAALSRILINFTKRAERDEERIAKIREEYPNAFHAWTKEDEMLLTSLFNEGKSIEVLSVALQRQAGGIKARLEKLGLAEKEKTVA